MFITLSDDKYRYFVIVKSKTSSTNRKDTEFHSKLLILSSRFSSGRRCLARLAWRTPWTGC